MSKNVKKSQKSSRNNYKIEALEPRLMMDAEPLDPALESNLDIQQFDSYAEQIGNLSDSIGEKAAESLGQFNKIDFTQFHLADKANAAIEFVADSAEQLKSVFADKVNTTLGNALRDLEKKFYTDEVALEDGKIKLADFVQNYVVENAEGTGLTFAVEGSKLVVNYDIEYAKNITDMGFDLVEDKLKLTSEGTALNTSAKLKAVIDLDKGGNGIILDETSDVGDFAVSVEELKISVDNLGMKAKFMNVVLEEVDKEGEDGPDLSISYASGSDVSQSVNLEFGLANSGELPFEFKDGELLTVATAEEGLDVSVPEIQMKGDGLSGLFSGDVLKNLPFIKESSFAIGEQQFNLPQLVEKVNDLWTKVSIALTSTVEPVQFYRDRVQLNLNSLGENLQIILGDSFGEWTELLDKLMVKAVGNGNEFYSLIGEPTEALHLMNLKDGAVLSFVISPKSLSLESLDIGLTSLEGLSADIALAFNVKVNVKDDSSISFAEVSLDDFSLKMGASLTDSNWGPVQLDGVKFNYDVKIDSDNDLQKNVALDYESVDLVVNGNILYSSASGSIICANPDTDEQKWSLNLDKGIIGDLPFVFDGDEVTFSKVDGVVTPNLPEFDLRESFSLKNAVSLLSSVKIPFINSDITEKITSLSSCWNKIVMAIQGAMEQGSDAVTISCKKLSALLAQFDKDETVKSALRELDLKYGENSLNLLADNDDDLTIQLKENADNVFALEFKVNSETLNDKLDFGVLELGDVGMDIAFSMNVKVHVAKPGDELQARICEVALNEASVHLVKSEIADELEFGKFKVDIKEGNLDLGIKIDSQMKVSFDENSGIDLENFKISFESFEVDNLNSSIVCNASEDGSQVWSLDLSSIKGELNDWPITISDSALKVCCDKGEWKFEVPSFEWNDSFSIVNRLNTLLRGQLVELPGSFNLDIPLGGDSTVKLSEVAEVINESFLDTFVLIKNAISAFDVENQLLTLDLSSVNPSDKQKQILRSLEIIVNDEDGVDLLIEDVADKQINLRAGEHKILLSFTPSFGQIDELDLGFTKLKKIDISAAFVVKITLSVDADGNCSFNVELPQDAQEVSFSQGTISFGYNNGKFDWGSFDSIQDFFKNPASQFSIENVLQAIEGISLVKDFTSKTFNFAGLQLSLNGVLEKVGEFQKVVAFASRGALAGESDALTLDVGALKNNQFLNDKIDDFKGYLGAIELICGTEVNQKLDLLKLDEATESSIALNGNELHIVFKLNLGEYDLDLKLFKLNQAGFELSLDCLLGLEKVDENSEASIKHIDVSSVGLEAGCDEISLNVGAASAMLSGCNFNVSVSLEDESVPPEIKLAYGSANVEILSETHNIEGPGEFSYSNGGWNIPDAITGLVEGFDIGVDFSLELALSALKDISSLPLVEKKIPNVSQIVKSLDEKWNPILQSIRSAVNEGKLKLGDLHTKITAISGIGDALSGLVVNGNDLLSGAGSDEGLDLPGLGGKLEVTLVPNIDLAGNDFTFDFLGKDICLKLDASLEITLELGFEITEDNKPSFESLSLKRATLSVAGSLDEGVEFSLGLVGVSFDDASLEVKLEVGDSSVKVPEVSFDLTGTELKIGGVAIKQFSNLEFGYNQDTGEWVIPEDLKQFMSFSGENLVQQVHMYLNTLQTALRNLVESKTKLDFLDGSIDKVVDICDKVEQLVYGFSEGTDEYGLLKCDEGRYVANFEGVDDFVTKFNDAWAELFFQGAEDAPTVCSMSYVYKVDGEEPIEVALKEDGSFDGLPDGAEFIGNRLVFNLSFNLGKEFELNFAKTLSSFDVASVQTSGYVSITGDAGFKFIVDVNFASPAINPDESVQSLLDLPKGNEKYTIFTVDDSRVNIESKLSIDVVKQGEGATSATVTVEAGLLTKNQIKTQGITAGLTSTNRIYLVSEQKFDFASSVDTKAFAELKLSSANLQTCFEAKVSDNKVVLYLVGREDSSEDKAALTIVLSEMEGFDNAEDKIAFINEYFSLQKGDDDSLNFVSFGEADGCSVKSIEPGNSIMNKFGLYVVDVIMDEDGKSVKTIKFGCDARRLQNYDASKKDEQGFKLTNESGYVRYMRISEELHGNGLEGYNAGVSQKVSITLQRGGETKSLEFVVSPFVTEPMAIECVDAINGTLEKDGLASYFKAMYSTVLADGNTDKFFYVMVAPIDETQSKLEEAAIFDTTLDDNDYEAWHALYDTENADGKVDEFQDKLDQWLNISGLLQVVTHKGDGGKYTLGIEVIPFTNTVKVINREITVSVGSTSVSVNVGDCATVSSVANAIEDAIKENVSLEGNDISVSVVGKNIVFTSKNDVEITCDALGPAEGKRTDFTVKVDGAEAPIDVDFESIVETIDDSTSFKYVIDKLNDLLDEYGLSIRYSEDGADDKYLDHLELVGNNPFCIENIGTSIILKQLGFSDAVAVKGADGKYRIVGSALSGMDFSKAFSLKGVSVYANMDLSLGTQIEDLKDKNFSFVDENTKNEVKLEFASTNIRNYNVGGFLKVGEEHYRITDVQNGYIAVSRTSYEGGKLSDETAKSSDFWKKATYVASASASLGFVGMDVFASGEIGVEACFNLEKNEDPKENNFFGFKIADGSGITVDGEPFGLKANADVFGTTVNLASGSIEVKYEKGNLSINPDFKVETDYTKIVDQFKNFSVEQLLAVLDGLVERLTKIVDGSNVTIPLINKSVGDLVDVAKDLQKVVGEMRQQKVTSVQQFVNYMNKRLLDSIFVPTEDGANLIDLSYKDGELYFDFNIRKDFSVRHRFDFGGSTAGINGEVNLNVTGGFWFSLSAKLTTAGEFDLLLNGDGIKFGADVEIVGDELRFNLGIGGDDKTFENNEGILKNLIQVGANGENAFVYGKACLDGHLGGEGFSIKTGKMLEEGASPSFDCKLPIAIIGKLPITVLDVSVGDILLGKWDCDEGKVAFDAQNIGDCRDLVEEALSDVENSTGLYVINLTELQTSTTIPEFSLILEENQKPGEGKTPFVADLSSVRQGIIDLANGNVSWFDKIKLGITALNTLFETLEAGINTNLGKTITSVPVVGPTLGAGVDFLSVLKDKVLEPFSNFVYESSGLTVEMVAEKMNDLFDAYFRENAALLDSLLLPEGDSESEISEWKRVGGAGTWYRSTNNSAEWFFQLGGSYDWGTSLGLDFGFPGLGLKADGGLDLKLDWSLDFGFGISETDGFYFIFNEGNEINVTASAKLNADINGALAGLGLSLQTQGGDNHAAVGLGFGLNLADFDEGKVLGKLELMGSELERLKVSNDLSLSGSDEKTLDRGIGKVAFSSALSKLEFSYAASVDVFASMLVGFGRDVEHPNTPAEFPNISGAFEFVWSKTNGSSGDGLTTLGFSNLSLDLGSFIDGVLGPIVSKIQKVVEPMEPLIDFLTTPFPVLKDVGISVTPLELAKKYGGGNFDDSMIKAIKSLISMTKQISAMKKNGLNIDLGDFMLVGEGINSFESKKFLNGSASNKSLDSSLSTYAKKLEKSSEITAQASNALGGQGLNVGEGGWDFIWNHPADIFKMLMGQDIDLVYYDMPKLSFNFDWDTFVSIWGPLGARLGVTFSASIDLSFGYDTLGIHQWIESDRKDYGSLVNGFYVGDRDKDGNDINELSFYGGLTAAAEINAGVKAGVGGGVGINVAFDLFDPNKDGKIRLNEMSQIVKADGLQGLFEISGKITAKLYAYVDLWLTKKKWNITGDITLFSFELKRNTNPILVSKNENGDVIAHVGDNSSSRLYTDDKNVSLEDGDEILDLTLGKNSVGSLDIESGKTFFINSKEGVDKLTLSSDVPIEYNLEIRGGEGDDVIDLSGLKIADGYYVVIWGGAGNDKIKAAEGLNIIFGDDGVYTPLDKDDKEKDKGAKLDDGDRFVVEGKFNAGVSGDDIILGNKGSQVIIGGVGSDKIRGKEGDNIILGDAGHVEFVVNDNGSIDMESVSTARTDTDLDGGNDYLFGGADVDYIVGGAGSDFIDGEEGSDTIKGERGDDYIFGGLGDDTIGGGSGSDIIFGDGFWSDSFDVSKSFDLDVFNDDFKKAHEGKFDGGLSLKRWLDLDDDGFDFLDIEKEISEPENIPEYGEDTINGDEGDDLIFGDAGDKEGKKDTIKGGIGNDVIDGDGGDDIISGGIDNDVIYGGSGSDIIDGGAGNDTIYGDDGAKVYTTNEEVFEKDPVVFGENFGLNEKIYKDAKSTSEGAGDDVITSGLGMDFVDGQEGNDTVIVNLSGGHDVNYTNVIDSGDENENNVLTIEGTELDDKLLMRMNNDKSLGFVALLPDDANNKNIERVNFNKGINEVNLNANGGNDSITIDGTAKTTNVDAGAGNDTIRVGQLYNADMGEANATTNVKNDDLFNTVAVNTNHGVKCLSDGVSAGSTLNIEGAAGDDTFALLHNAGEELKVSGGNGNDGFSMYAFSAIENGVMSIDGGRGIDSLMVRGSESSDLIVVSKDGLLSSFGAVQVAGVETKNFDAAGGEDIFNVVGSSEKETIVLNGGNGSDTVVVGGGLTESEILRGSNNQGQNASLKYEIMDDEGLADDEKNQYDTSAAGKSFEEKYSIINTSSVPSVFVSSSDTSILPVKAEYVTEGDENGVLAFYVGCSGDLKSGTVSVKLRTPKLTTSELQSGDAGILVGYEDEYGQIKYSDFCDIQFKTSGKVVKVYVKAISDGLYEGDILKSIAISSTWDKGDGSDPVNLEDSAKSASVIVKGDSDSSQINQNLLSWSEVFKVDASTKKISLDAVGSDFAEDNIHAYYIDVDTKPILNFKSETEKWEVVGLSEGTLVVNYRSNKAQIDSSKIRIAYDNIESLDMVKLDEKIILSKADYENPQKRKGANVDTSVYYELAGNMLVFFNSSTRQLVTLHGVLSVDSKMGPNIENDEVLEQLEDKCDFLTIKEHTHTLVEATKNASEATPEAFTYTEFTVEYNGTIADNKKVRIKITVEDALRSIGGDKSAEDLYLKYEDQEGDTVIVTLENGSTSSTIRLVAKCDTVNEEYGLVDAKSSGSGNKLDDVKGAIYAYGKGESIEVDYDNPVMLKYNHFVDKDGKVINSYNESSGTEEEESPAPMTDSDTDDLNSVDRIMVNNYDSDAAATSQLRSLDGRDLYYATRDYEGLYDLYKGIESSMLKQDDALRFTLRNPSTTTLLTYFGVSMSEFEFGEFNLGTGADKVVVSKTLHRDDGFQTFTVVNTGDGNDVSDDEITVNRYDSENDGQLVINAQGGKDKITATGSKITKDGMVVLGGAGADEIKVDSGVIAFGDKGNIQYKDGDTVVTELGYYGEDVGEHKAGDIIRTETGKLQTDGVVRGASSIASVMPSEGDADDITASGQMSVVIGGSGSDKITVTGEKNVVLGDNGVVNFHNEGSAESWRENNITTSLEKVQTINNSVGEIDTINIAGSHNVVMGGNGGDKITIGESGKENGIDNVVLGDGGVAEFTQGVATIDNFMVNAAIKSVKTEDDSDGARDEIKIYGGLNTVMGGAGNDDITIGDEDKDEDHQNGNENVVLGDGGSYVVDKDNGEVTVKTSREEIDDAVVIHGGEDTIKIYGGQNTVMGGAEGDTIDIFGADNIVLGDGGESIREWNADNEVYDSIKSVMTTDDDNGGVDTINIHGGKNAVMGGFDGDTITIGDEVEDGEPQNGNENVVLGDGGSYVVDKDNGEVTVKTSREEIDDTVVIHGGEDTIAIHGGQNTVIGGAEGDTIDIFGADNIVLGDGGESIREWNADNEVYDSIKSVMTTDDDNGGVDTINIHGGKNAVMGGFDGDTITIGDEVEDGEPQNGNENVVLGEGGSYVVDKDNGEVTVKTSREEIDDAVVIHGGEDTIAIHGGQNTVMGGAEGDTIDIFGADNIVLGDGGVSVREWNEEKKIYEAIKSVKTTDDNNGGIDTINIYGGQNAVMGGFDGDNITIGTQNGATSDNNIVLGDGGEYNNEASDSAYIKTQSDAIGGEDHIKVFGGHNVAMGGFAGDEIEIHGGENVVLGDGGIANYDKKPGAATVNDFINSGLRDVTTTSDGVGGHDDIDIFGDKNVVMGGADGDIIDIAGKDNVVVGDGGRYDIHEDHRTIETKSEQDGGSDIIHTDDGKNIVMGGMDADEITTGDGNDIILGDGGFAKVDYDFNALFVTNENINVGEDLGTAGADTIIAGNGDNVVFGGLGNDDITTGNGQDVVFGDNAYATFRGNANEAFEQVGDRQNVPDVYEEATLSFNFQGASQTGLNATDYVGAPEFESHNWNNISGSLAGTYGNDDREIVNMDNLDATGEKSAEDTRTRVSGVSVSYGGYESHRNTSTDNRINLQAYNLGLWNMQGDKNAKLMNSGLMTTAPNAQCGSKFEVAVDGLAQYFTSYKVVVYLDIPDSHSAYGSSVRKVSLFVGGSEEPYSAYYVNDAEGHNFDGSFVQATATSADTAEAANYVVFDVPAGAIADNFRVVIEEAYPNNAQNGKNLAGIAGIQVRGTLHKQDVAATTDIDFGGDDIIKTGLGDDIVVGGTGSDDITTFGDERYGIYDNDVVFGDNAKILLSDRDSDESTASTISTAESVAVTNIDTATYDDTINTGDGNDTVVGGIGADTINAGATEAAEAMLDGVKAASVNFTLENADASLKVGPGETAGVVADTAWCNMYVKNGELHDVDNYSSHSVKGINVTISSYQQNSGWWNEMYAGNYAMTHENSSELDGDTANSKLFNGYLASQQHDEIKLTLDSIDQFRAQSGLAAGDACDIYVYLGADNGDTDTYNYIYQVSLNNGEKRFLNDWTGYNFDGDYREASCDSYEDAMSALHEGSAVRMEIVGNYVVFRNFTGNRAEIRIKNVYTSSGQNPKNLPVINAVQVVAGAGKDAAAIGGDHDKDLVYGDDARLTFDLDVPYAVDENISDYANRVIGAESLSIAQDAVTTVYTGDTIVTGKDRDVVVGGEGADTITTGAGDDIALGGSANLVLEHNNPLGVFTPNTEIVLDQHTIDTTLHQNYLDNDTANVGNFQARLDQGLIDGVQHMDNGNDRHDEIDAGEGRNLVSQGNDDTGELVVVPDNGQGGEGGNGQQGGEQQSTRQFVLGQREVMSYVEISAGETIEIVLTDWNEGNQYYHPNVVLQMSGTDNVRHTLYFSWDGLEEPVPVSLFNYDIVDIPDSSNVAGEHRIVLRVRSDEDVVFMASAGNR